MRQVSTANINGKNGANIFQCCCEKLNISWLLLVKIQAIISVIDFSLKVSAGNVTGNAAGTLFYFIPSIGITLNTLYE